MSFDSHLWNFNCIFNLTMGVVIIVCDALLSKYGEIEWLEN